VRHPQARLEEPPPAPQTGIDYLADRFAQQQAADVERPVALVAAIVALAIVIALLWSMNTLGLSVVERRRELGMLRILGMTRVQLAAAVAWEAAMIAFIGVAGGALVGGALGVTLFAALRDTADVPARVGRAVWAAARSRRGRARRESR